MYLNQVPQDLAKLDHGKGASGQALSPSGDAQRLRALMADD